MTLTIDPNIAGSGPWATPMLSKERPDSCSSLCSQQCLNAAIVVKGEIITNLRWYKTQEINDPSNQKHAAHCHHVSLLSYIPQFQESRRWTPPLMRC
jgi:hypothetical protein